MIYVTIPHRVTVTSAFGSKTTTHLDSIFRYPKWTKAGRIGVNRELVVDNKINTRCAFSVIFPIVAGGAALIFASTIAATSLVPAAAAGGLGLLGIG